MQLKVTYSAGVWEFELFSEGEEEDFHDEFEITELIDAQDAAFEAIKQLKELAEADENAQSGDREYQ
jgi:hypothetical protein